MANGSFLNGNGKKKIKQQKSQLMVRTGNWTGWHENGVKWSEISFKNGKKHGFQKIGMIMVKKNFKENTKMTSQ